MQLNLEKTKVIIIAVSRYDDETLNPLPHAEDNAGKLRNTFIREIGIPREQVRVLLNPKNKPEVQDEIEDFSKGAKHIFIYYAGHGVMDENDDWFLTLQDAKVSRIRRYGLPPADLSEVLPKKAGVFLIMDSCFSERAFNQFSQSNFYLLASSAKNITSKYPLNEEHSAFSGKLLEIIEKGIAGGNEMLTFRDIYLELKQRLEADDFPAPRQNSANDLQELPVFVNKASSEQATKTEPPKTTLTASDEGTASQANSKESKADDLKEITALKEKIAALSGRIVNKKKNVMSIQGDGNIAIQGVEGSTLNIRMNGGDSGKPKSFRQERSLRRLAKLEERIESLDELIDKLREQKDLAHDSREEERLNLEIRNAKNRLEGYEEEYEELEAKL